MEIQRAVLDHTLHNHGNKHIARLVYIRLILAAGSSLALAFILLGVSNVRASYGRMWVYGDRGSVRVAG